MKKALYVLLLAVLCVSLFVSCESNVKKGPFRVGTERYESLPDAVKAASDGDTIYLEEDASTKGCIISKDITLDLKKHTLTLADSKSGIIIFRNKTLIMVGSGNIVAGAGFTARHLIHALGTVKLLNTNVYAQGYETGALSASSGSIVIFEASHILADEGQHAIYLSGDSYCYINTVGMIEGTVKTEGGSVVDFRNADLSTEKLKFDYESSKYNPVKAIRVSTLLYEEYEDTFKAVEEANELLAYDHDAGIVFFDTGSDEGEWRYLMAAHYDLRIRADGEPSVNPNDPGYYDGRSTFNFGYCGTDYGTNISIGDGLHNTELLAADPSDQCGAWFCDRLVLTTKKGTYEDWFLPSFDELNSMYEHLHNKGAGGFDQELYLSSSETDASAMDTAAALYFNGWERGELAAPNREADYLAVRPVRRFK
jgi:hypothetical protein